MRVTFSVSSYNFSLGFLPIWNAQSHIGIPTYLRRPERFSGRPPIPRPSQLLFSPRNLRVDVSERLTSGGQKPVVQVSVLSSLGAWPAGFTAEGWGETVLAGFTSLTHGSARANATLSSESPAKTCLLCTART